MKIQTEDEHLDNPPFYSLGGIISGREWILALSLAGAVTILLTVPYILGYGLARPGTVFTGVLMNPEDSQSYFAKMLQGYDGRWFYTITYTSEDHVPALVGTFYIVLGHIARLLGLTAEIVWHGARVIADMFMFTTTFVFIATFIRDYQTRWIAYLLAIFSSGLGWLLLLAGKSQWLGAFPVDFKMPEAHLFFTGLTFPHVAVAIGLMLAYFLLLIRMSTNVRRNWFYAVLAGLVVLVLGFVFPFIVILMGLTVASYWLYSCLRSRSLLWKVGALYLVSFVILAPLFLYFVLTARENAAFQAWLSQAITPSPPIPHYAIAYGALLLFAILPLLLREHPVRQGESTALLWIWIFSAALLVYAPLSQQRRFVLGVQIPLAILASIGLTRVVLPALKQTGTFRRLVQNPRYSMAGLERLFIFLFLAVMSLSNIYVLADLSANLSFRQPYPFFRTHAEIAAINWIQTNTDRSDIIFAGYQTGNYLGAHAGNHVVIGHWAETTEWEKKYREAYRFYNPLTDDQWRRDFLNHYNVSYVWLGPEERSLGQQDLDEADYLRTVYRRDGIELFEVR
jgi:hypothetical protein